MKFHAYDDACERTISPDLTRVQRLDLAALGLAGETGEMVDMIKKHLYHGAHLDHDAVRKELGDVLWYLSLAARTVGTNLEEVAIANAHKLRARYPDGFVEGGGIR